MKTIATTLIAALLATISFGQQFTPEALTPAEHNEWGDPISNIIDPNGAKQGDWTYQDIDGKLIVKEEYENHKLKNVYYSTLNSDGTPNWKVSTEWSSNPEFAEKLEKKVKDKFEDFTDEQQILILFNANGKMTRFAALGIWNPADAQRIEKTVREFLKNNSKLISDETVILL